MNRFDHLDSVAIVPWLTSDPRVPLPPRYFERGSDPAPRGVVGHQDAGAATRLGLAERHLARAGDEALPEQPPSSGASRDAWMQSLQRMVNQHPLVSVGAVLAAGAVIARLFG